MSHFQQASDLSLLAEDDTFEETLSTQTRRMESMKRVLVNYNRFPRQRQTIGAAKASLEQLEGYFSDIKVLDRRLYRLADTTQAQNVYFTQTKFAMIEDQYIQDKAVLYDAITQLTPPAIITQAVGDQNGGNSLFKLERLKPPKFSGDIKEWKNYHHLCLSLIHDNESLPTIQKFFLLRGTLEGEPLNLIKDIEVTEANYASAWRILTNRYDDQNRLIWAHLKSLFSVKRMKNESAEEALRVHDQTVGAREVLLNLKRKVEHWDDILVYLTVNKMDIETRKHWELNVTNPNAFPSFTEVRDFLEERAKRLERLPTNNTSTRSTSTSTFKTLHTVAEDKVVCLFCKENHSLSSCSSFKAKSVVDKRDFVKDNSLCFNCLQGNHGVRDCEHPGRCKNCKKKHHTFVCPATSKSRVEKSTANTAQISNESSDEENSLFDEHSKDNCSSEDEEEIKDATACQSSTHNPTFNHVLLATARVRLRTSEGREAIVRALLDQGSELSFISEAAAQTLRSSRVKVNLSISGVNGNKTATCKSAVSCLLEPCDATAPSLQLFAHVLPKLTSYAPYRKVTNVKWKYLQELKLADPDPNDDRRIDLIIGADLYPAVMLEGIRKGSPTSPMAQETIFGWVVSGPQGASQAQDHQLLISAHHCSISDPVDQLMRRFWELEELPNKTELNEEDQWCENHFKATHARGEDGRYLVHLPLKSPLPLPIGESYGIARKCLERQMRRLNTSPERLSEYNRFLDEYLSLEHMSPSPRHDEPHQRPVYLPHHAVIREDSKTSPIRVVFNASSPTTNGTTFNDHLYIGPQLLPDLLDIILKWRMHPIALRADIEKMFRQILIVPEERHLQRILWQPADSTEPIPFDLKTVTYETGPAPFLANRTLKQLAEDERERFPRAAAILERDFYVDDVLTGTTTIQEAKEIQKELQLLLQTGGMNLRKWASSHIETLSDVPRELLAHDPASSMDQSGTVKVLGVQWCMGHDVFKFSAFPLKSSKTTKRNILSTVSRIFDPAGWLTPSTITAKILIQELWLLGMDWDEEVPEAVADRWDKFQSQLIRLQEISINRFVNWTPEKHKLELHGFCDASTQAYAAVVYLRIHGDDHNCTKVELIIGKSKVAPIKHQTVAKLELCGAHLLARALERVRATMGLEGVPVYAWTDSRIVLAWLQKHSSHWPTFVANRVSDIQTRVPSAHWSHVPTSTNPADCASRGVSPSDLVNHELWWSGPQWLKLEASRWPQSITTEPKVEQEEPADELLTITGCLAHCNTPTIHVTEPEDALNQLLQLSPWGKVLRIVARCLLFLNKRKKNPKLSFATLLRKAHDFWMSRAQDFEFSNQIKLLKNNQQLPSRDKLCRLHPFLDEKGIIRLGGRVANASNPYDETHPIILPAGRVADLIITDTHFRTQHGGLQLSLCTLRQRYWILNARRLVKSHIHKCVQCIRYDGKPMQQLMAGLPSPRVTPSPPFSHSGLDYAGPVNVRTSPGRGHKSHKGYIALFVCMATRAIHLELVSDYTTSTFLAALDRFVSRRGLPSDLYSDNGTNFQGAERELREAATQLFQDEKLKVMTATRGIQWHFIPPLSPHFGGLWEAGVKSVKNLLKRILRDYTPTFEEWTTLLSKIECNLNSRPIGLLRDDPDDIAVLTPGHFLIGRPLNAVPMTSTLELNPNRLSRWQLIQHLNEAFWKRWRDEYLHTLHTRHKWTAEHENLKIDDIVLIQDVATAPSKWPLARVIELYHGDDGKVRAAKLKASTSIFVQTSKSRPPELKTTTHFYTRPIVKLILLPVGDVMAGGAPPTDN